MPNHFEEQLNVEIRITDKWTNQTNLWFVEKYCQDLLEHVSKNGPDILGLQVQTIQPELVGVNSVCLWNFMSVIVSSEQLDSYVLWN